MGNNRSRKLITELIRLLHVTWINKFRKQRSWWTRNRGSYIRLATCENPTRSSPALVRLRVSALEIGHTKPRFGSEMWYLPNAARCRTGNCVVKRIASPSIGGLIKLLFSSSLGFLLGWRLDEFNQAVVRDAGLGSCEKSKSSPSWWPNNAHCVESTDGLGEWGAGLWIAGVSCHCFVQMLDESVRDFDFNGNPLSASRRMLELNKQ